MVKNFKQTVLVYLIILFAIQDMLQMYVPVLKYTDEIIAAMFFVVLLFSIRKNSGKLIVKKKYAFFALIFLIFLFSGIVGNVRYKFQPSTLVLKDVFLCSKFFLAFGGAYMFWQDEEINFLKLKLLAKRMIVMLFLLEILDYFFHLFRATVRYGIRAEQLWYSHPTYFAAALVFLGCVFLYRIDLKKDFIVFAILLFMLVSTLRMKAIGFALAAVLLTYYTLYKKRKITITKWTAIAGAILFVVWNQIEFYFVKLSGQSARSVMLMNSFKLARDYFPFGTGFATYGSQAAAEMYSPVYLMLGFRYVYELSPDNSSAFLVDTFWPIVIGQTGVLGTVCFLSLIVFFYKEITRSYASSDVRRYYTMMLILIYLVISSVAETAFFNPMAVPLGVWLGILMSRGKGTGHSCGIL